MASAPPRNYKFDIGDRVEIKDWPNRGKNCMGIISDIRRGTPYEPYSVKIIEILYRITLKTS